ncbi:MAG TPA: glycosyl hydrolase family 28 protein [Kiritimatiellia bacterium]|nr:glycosyl hydrolase family 28 protein [Kiritimatiellia bacterium]HRU71238.1 glycosyl hydrolase family 28 protein [Kiritimatiellia bacterium]
MTKTALWLTLTSATVFGRTFDITTYGAKPDRVTDNTAAIQQAIDDCTAAGGGQVLVPGGGVYKTYTLNLRNNVDLHIERGATLKAGEDPYKFPEFTPNDVWNAERSPRFNKRAMFYTCGQTNVAITGSGTIDGNAEAYHHRENGRWQRNSHTNICGRCVFFVGCRDVRFDDVLVYHPCGWSTWFLDCDRVQVKGVRIECHREFPNGDGLHFGGCRDVTVSDCLIDAQDDALIVRTHQEQMKKVRACERMTFANCVLRSNQSAIRIGWTEDGPIRDVSFDNIVCTYSRLGVQFYLPPLPDPPREYMDPPRGRGVVPPPRDSIVPFSVENMRFSNMSINSFHAPFYVAIADTENVDFIKGISFAHCRFRAQRPPVVACRPEDNVRDWRFSDVVFEIMKPRGTTGAETGVWGTTAGIAWFENVRNVTMDNVRWDYFPDDRPEWYVTLKQIGDGDSRPVRLTGARQPVREEKGATGGRVFVCDTLTDGCNSWQVQVEIEERATVSGKTYTGRVINNDPGILVTAFDGPFSDRIPVIPYEAALAFEPGFGERLTKFPTPGEALAEHTGWEALKEGPFVFDTALFPDQAGRAMPWVSLNTGRGVWRFSTRGDKSVPVRFRLRWTASERIAEVGYLSRLTLNAGETWNLPEIVFARTH